MNNHILISILVRIIKHILISLILKRISLTILILVQILFCQFLENGNKYTRKFILPLFHTFTSIIYSIISYIINEC